MSRARGAGRRVCSGRREGQTIASQSVTRRQFLLGASRLAVGAGTAGLVLRRRAEARGLDVQISPAAWHDLSMRLSGPVVLPGDPSFATIARPENIRYADVVPAGIARCADARDVAQSILWSREHGVSLVARGGGHSYAGYSTTSGLMIDLSPIDGVRFDAATGVVTVGGGARNGDVYDALQPLDVAITHGRCPTVGVGGFFLGGGIGFNMRARGLGCDQLVATEIVTADGRIQRVEGGSDLFWACRGGAGGNFGINTAFSVQTFPVSSLTVFSITWISRPEDVFAALLDALDAGPPGLGSRVALFPVTEAQHAAGADASVSLLGQFTGTPAELLEILAPVYRVAAPQQATIERRDYWDAQINFLEVSEGDPTAYQERSRFFADVPGATAIATAFDWSRRWPGTSAGAATALFQTGAAVNAPAADATAFVHRDSRWLLTISLNWTDADAPGSVARNRDWQDGYYEAMAPLAGGGAYQNFPDPSLGGFLDAYYGANLGHLRRVKAAVDPSRVFRYAQAIPPA